MNINNQPDNHAIGVVVAAHMERGFLGKIENIINPPVQGWAGYVVFNAIL